MSDTARVVEPPEPPRRRPSDGATPSFEALLASGGARPAAGALLEAWRAAAGGAPAGLVVALVVVGLPPYSSALKAVLVALIPRGAFGGAAAVPVRRGWPLRHDPVVGA